MQYPRSYEGSWAFVDTHSQTRKYEFSCKVVNKLHQRVPYGVFCFPVQKCIRGI